LTERGQGTTADAVKAIRYAVDNGARILSNSWGSEGDNPQDGQGNQALKDAILYAQSRGVLFIAAAGNGHAGKGYDNDNDARPGVPASYDFDNIISVAAIDAQNSLGSFSNWGVKSVDIAAPGVNVYSTIPGGRYADQVINNKFLKMIGIQASWDGTSMATPHVAGAAAVYWSKNPSKTYKEVKEALIKTAVKLPTLEGKILSGGKLSLKNLITN
jgi:subtilisin family serine protease